MESVQEGSALSSWLRAVCSRRCPCNVSEPGFLIGKAETALLCLARVHFREQGMR